MAIPTHQEWVKLRDAAGGSAGLVKNVNVGKLLDQLDTATKGASGLARMLAQVRPLNDLDKGLRIYRKAVPTTKPKLAALVDDILKTVDAHIADGQKMANPVHNMTSHLREAITKSKAIATSGDPKAYQGLWMNEVRGAGTGFAMLIKIDPSLAPVYKKFWEPFTSDVWDLTGDKVAGTTKDPAQIKAKVRAAATKINFAALNLQRELQKLHVTS